LFRKIDAFTVSENIGEVYYAPVDVYLDGDSCVVQPDIIFVKNGGQAYFTDEGVYGAPQLVIEILSPSNEDHDNIRKKALYERFGVQEYWIIDPETKQCNGFSLLDGIYHPLPAGIGKVSSQVFNCDFTF
jgi:Uma2 family endonuclease